MYRKVRENSRPRDLRLFTSTKGVVSVIKTSCAHSVTLKRFNKTPHSFLHFHIVIWTRKLLWKYMSCLSKLLLHELWPKQLRERFIIVAKLYIFLLKKQDNILFFGRFHLQMNKTSVTTLYLYAFLFTLSAWLCDVTFSANRSCKSSRL